jgi:hypothetical protein
MFESGIELTSRLERADQTEKISTGEVGKGLERNLSRTRTGFVRERVIEGEQN